MTEKKERIVCVSGGFDPVHVGHIRLIKEARQLGDKLVIIMNNDNWLLKKKGFVFMQEAERKEVLNSLKYVDEIIVSEHESDCSDMSVCSELRLVKPSVFANGGDRKSDNTPEYLVCEEMDIEMVFEVGGDKIQSSSDLVLKNYSGEMP